MSILISPETHICKMTRSKSQSIAFAAAACLLLAGTMAAQAQSASTPATAPASAPLASYSSSVDNSAAQPVTLTAANLQPTLFSTDSLAGAQNGPYARPAYRRDRHSDFSKYSFAVGFGFDVPAGSTANYQTTGWDMQIAGGRNLNRVVGAQVQYDYDHFGIPGYILNDVGEPNGDVHLWSITVDPYINVPTHGSAGMYLIGGGGFFRKLTEFTQPYTSCYYYCYSGSAVVAHFSNNAGGASLGTGFTWRVSRWNNAKFYSEARYTWVANQNSGNNTSSTGYPPANYRTGYFPVVMGLRW
jgi:hypothetical protein